MLELTNRAEAVRPHEAWLDQFIVSFRRPPRRLVLDFNVTDDPMHGMQGAGSSTGTSTATGFCPCMFFAATCYWRRTCARARAMASGLVEGEDRFPRRQRLLPAADAVVARAQQRGLRRRHRPPRGAGQKGESRHGTGGHGA